MRDSNPQRSHIGRSLFEASTLFNKVAVGKMKEQGFANITKMDIDIISQVPSDKPTNAVTIAASLGISKQAVSQKVKSMVDRGYLKKENPSPDSDTRFSQISFTEKGQELLACGLRITQELEERFVSDLGVERFTELGLLIKEVLDSLENHSS